MFGRGNSKSSSDDGDKPNPVLDEFRKKNPSAVDNKQSQQQQMVDAMRVPGDIASSSIFEDERRTSSQKASGDMEASEVKIGGNTRDPKIMARVLNPDPNARERWERKKVIQMVRKGGRLTNAQMIKRTEREHLVKSHNMKSSVKKLGMLARQIQGKTIDDAIVQMRFSKKRVAQEVLKQLEFARDEAVVMRGMGLGKLQEQETEDAVDELATGMQEVSLRKDRPVEIQLKDGKRHRVEDRSKIYIDQAWVGRGPYGQLPDYRARGRVFIMRTPWTSLSVVLKEEATRVRQWEEREAKRVKQLKEKVWVPLPDRPIQTQRQWFSW